MTASDEDEDSRPISVAELLARNGIIGSPPVGGHRRRRRGRRAGGVSVSELTGEIPVIRSGEVNGESPGSAPDVAAEVAEEVIEEADEVATEVATEVADEVIEEVIEEADEVADADVAEEADEEVDEVEEVEEVDEVEDVEDVVEEADEEVAEADVPQEVAEEPDEEVEEAEDVSEAEVDEEVAEETDEEVEESEDVTEETHEDVTEDVTEDVSEEAAEPPARSPATPPLANDPRPRRGSGPELSEDPRPQRRPSDAERMAFDPVDESVDLAELIGEQAVAEELAEGGELRSYLNSTGGPLFSGETVADDIARRGAASETLAEGRGRRPQRSESRLAALRHGAVAVLQSIVAVVFGAGLFIGFDQLWRWNTIVALVLSVLVILGLVIAVRVVRRTEDIASTLIAVAVGALVTLGPLALLQST